MLVKFQYTWHIWTVSKGILRTLNVRTAGEVNSIWVNEEAAIGNPWSKTYLQINDQII